MPLRPLLSAAALALAGCSSPAEVAERTGVGSDAAAGATARSSGGEGRKIAESTDLFEYGLSYPAEVARIPALADKLEADGARVKAEMLADAESIRADARANGYPFNSHSYSAEWQVVADLPAYLSLSNLFAAYSGGAHGMYGMEGFVWDKANRRGFASADMFRSPSVLGSAVGDKLCEALDAARAEKGIEPPAGEDPVFPACPGLDEATILVGSSNGKTFDRITVWYGPYVAGSYAEGAYELDFPMTAAMVEAVKPAYRTAFSVKR